jgi:hypothetical protein
MNENLRPNSLGEILDRTAQLYRGNFWPFAGVAAVPMGTMLAIAVVGVIVFLVAQVPVGAKFAPSVTVILVVAACVAIAVPIYIAAYVFCCAGLTDAAASVQRGEKPTIRAALKNVLPRFWSYLAFLFLQGVVVILIPGAIAAVVVASLFYLMTRAGLAGSVAIGFVVFLVIVAAVVVIAWLALSYAMGMAACVVEKKSPWESMQRAAQLSKGTRGRIFVMFLLVVALGMVVSMIAYIPFTIVVAFLTASGTNVQSASTAIIVAQVLNFVVNVALQVVLTPVAWIALVLFYYDQRVRKEGFDIERMMELAGMTQPRPAMPPGAGGAISGLATPPDTVGER